MAFWEKYGVHTGSWGLPDFGITEAFASERTPEGGSDIIPNQQAVAPPAQTTNDQVYGPSLEEAGDYTGGGDVLGTNTQQNTGGTPQTTQTGGTPQNTQTTQSGSGDGGSSGPTAEELLLQKRQQEANNLYNTLQGRFDKMAGLYDQNRQNWENRISNIYSSNQDTLQAQKQGAMQDIEGYRGDVRTTQKKTLGDLAQDFRNMLRAGQMQLGAAGAGSSSAVPMYSYALAKQENRRRGDVMAQSREMLNELNQKEQDVKMTYNEQGRQLDRWKEQKMGEIGDTYTGALAEIEQMRGAADQQKAQLKIQALEGALNRLNQLDAQAMNYKNTLDEWARNRVTQLNNYKMEIGKLSDFQPRQLAYKELQGFGANPRGQQEQVFMNPMARKKKDFEDTVKSVYL
jgi:hypothetical protein